MSEQKKIKLGGREFTEDDEKEAIGLVDGGVTHLECSNCGRGLINIWRTQPSAIDPRTGKPFVWKMKAKCCFCGDHSYVKEIKGKFYLGGYAKTQDDDNVETRDNGFEEVDIDGEAVLLINTVKA